MLSLQSYFILTHNLQKIADSILIKAVVHKKLVALVGYLFIFTAFMTNKIIK